jgi:hypothetical protein
MDIQQSRKSTSQVAEQLRPLVAHNHPRLFEEFLDYIDPTKEVERQKILTESTGGDGIPSPRQPGSRIQSDHSTSMPTGLFSRSFKTPVHPPSPLRHVVNFPQSPVQAESPSFDRISGNDGSPGMYGFPQPPLFYSPTPPTFAQSFFDYANQDRPILPYAVQTTMPTHDLPLPPITAVRPHYLQNINNG